MSRVTLLGNTDHACDYIVVGLDHACGFFLQRWSPYNDDAPTIDVDTASPFPNNRVSRGRIIELVQELARPSPARDRVCSLIAADLDPALT